MATLLLTRPEEASLRFAAQIADPKLNIIISPVLGITPVSSPRPAGAHQGLIFSSANAVTQFQEAIRLPSYVVGRTTAAAVEARGGEVRHVALNGEALANWMLQHRPDVPLLHVCGRHVAVPVAERLTEAGLRCDTWCVYTQEARALSQDARAALEREENVILPLFSPRSAAILVEQLSACPAGAVLTIIAMSAAVAQKWTAQCAGTDIRIAARPDAKAMLAEVRMAAEKVQLLESRRSLP
ncbi:uroporphyrinogen-III synthase [Primorskyibacter sp. S187A]|uniref:uroporphyrinogen-III synthase n=1 Tax=Primorskyibacter sp. S187A TaxID=3415130 RepID=UPI003C7E703A